MSANAIRGPWARPIRITAARIERKPLAKFRIAVNKTAVRALTAIADRGYFKGEEIVACEAITAAAVARPTRG